VQWVRQFFFAVSANTTFILMLLQKKYSKGSEDPNAVTRCATCQGQGVQVGGVAKPTKDMIFGLRYCCADWREANWPHGSTVSNYLSQL
jgi:hypothetical protein